MAQETLVNERIEDGRKFVTAFARDVAAVESAFWARRADEGEWYLYVVTPAVDVKGRKALYSDVPQVLAKLANTSVSPFGVKLLSPNEPVSVWVSMEKVDRRFVNTVMTFPNFTQAGNVAIDAIYIYPPLPRNAAGISSMSHDEVKRTVFDLLDRKGMSSPATVKLHDGTLFQGIPFGVEVINDLMNVKFIDYHSHLPREVRVDEILSIQ